MNAFEQTNRLVTAFEKVRNKYNIKYLQADYVDQDNCSITISFDIKNKEEYMHSYMRCIRVLQKTFQLGMFTHCWNSWTRWEKGKLEYNLNLMEWDCYNFPCIETQKISISKVEKEEYIE